ncbi:MAG TPA: indolepyruvate oxidoreductase subunit beta family protein [Xanthobacteraceae bacterium]|nr:indolepyruvate oxidoreductase subunit beta family protein [Xanthobacteraceae bacterium]
MSGEPVKLLIAALGGEGGGVLTDWIVSAAERKGFPVQSTSIPGVAQRTGATTYYIEIVPVPARELSGKRPVLALTPGIADIDIALASELMEAGRLAANGFVTADRTALIASTSRFYAMDEKIAMADGRYDQERLIKALGDNTKSLLLFDIAETAKRAGAMVNALMLGALAESSLLPISIDEFEAAIAADAKAVESNLSGFRAGVEAARNRAAVAAKDGKRGARERAELPAIEKEIAAMPEAARGIIIEGARRLTNYQDLNYARLYLDRLQRIRETDNRADAGGKLLAEAARHLAVRMSYEDVIRVAQAKIDPARITRIIAEMRISGDPYAIYEFLKPGIEEFCQILPPFLARPILRISARFGWLDRFHWGMEVNTASISGYLRFWLLTKLRAFRPRTHRFIEEQAAIESWLDLIAAAAGISPSLALEVAECARLIKGYGDTHKRGAANFHLIETRVIRAALAGEIAAARATDAVASARTAALVDPEGESLARCLAEIEGRSAFRAAAE